MSTNNNVPTNIKAIRFKLLFYQTH